MIFQKKFWLPSTILAAFLPAVSALAADMPVKAGPIVAANFDWSGVYVGVHAGYGGGMKDRPNNNLDFSAKGFLGGGQVGINKQLGSLVFGLELDGSWADIKGSQNIAIGGPPVNFLVSQTGTSKIDGLVTFAGRAGLASDRWFVFAKGGLTYAHEAHSINTTNTALPGGALLIGSTASGSEYRVAPMVGFGAEYALGNNWSVKAEYDYIHLGARNVSLTGTVTTSGVTAPFRNDVAIEQAIHVAKLGVNYRFGGIQVDPSFAPVPAAPGYNWSGAYVGAEGGYGFGHKEWPDFAGLTPDSGKYDTKGWLAGGTVGVNAQAGVFVFGVEGEWMWTGVKGSQAFTATNEGLRATASLESKVNWLAIAGARAGFVVGDKLLFYGKAGVALADETHTITQSLGLQDGSLAIGLEAKALHTGG